MKHILLPVCISLLLLLQMPSGLRAAPMALPQLRDIASAPVLVTGRIFSVRRNERVPDDQLAWKAETWSMTADVDVLRVFTASGRPLDSSRIEVHFLAYWPSLKMMVSGGPPPLPDLKPGEVHILPLRENRNPANEPWRLVRESGFDTTVLVRAERTGEPEPARGGLAFLIGEFANTLSVGTPREIAALGLYLRSVREDISGDLMPLLSQQIGNNRQQWAEVATSLYAAQGIPRPTVADLFAAKPGTLPSPFAGRGGYALIQAALLKLGPSPETDDLLIRTWMANIPYNAGGSANSLIEYADRSLTTELVRRALVNDIPGSSNVAAVVARFGNRAIIPDAVVRAFRVLDDPRQRVSGFNEVHDAAALIRDYGSDQDMTRLAALVRKYQTLDPEYYRQLWQAAAYSDNPREARVLAVVLADRRIAFENWRYCDLALEEFGRLTKEKFNIGALSVPERDAAIARALEWIRTH